MDLYFNLGVAVVLIAAFGYLSNRLNWGFLNYRITRFLYYIGTFVHELSHAVLCVATGAKIEKFQVFSSQPQVVHQKSKIPYLGELLISIAPIAGGLLFLFLLNKYFLGSYFMLPSIHNFHDLLVAPLDIILQINLMQWQSWVMIALFFNVGAMIGPSLQDLKNIWPVLLLLFFVGYVPLVSIAMLALSLIFINIIIQIVAIVFLAIVHRITHIL